MQISEGSKVVSLMPAEAEAVVELADYSNKPTALLASLAIGISRRFHDGGEPIPVPAWAIRPTVEDAHAHGRVSTHTHRVAVSVAGQLAARAA